MADNRYAPITRACTPSGLLLTDFVAFGIYRADDVSRLMLSTYDRDGRRSTMEWQERAGSWMAAQVNVP